MDNFSFPIISVIGGASNQLTKQDKTLAAELGELITKLGMRVMTKSRDQVFDALVLGANKVERAPLISSLDDNAQVSSNGDAWLSLNKTNALYLISSLIIVLPGGVETLADASYLIWQGNYSARAIPLIFWGKGWKAILAELSKQEYLDDKQKDQIIFVDYLDDIEKRLKKLT